MAIETGSVILIDTQRGQKLAVVQGRKRVSWIPDWRGYYVWVDGKYESVSDEAILDPRPACPYCEQRQWYVTEGTQLYLVGKVLCRTCHPPTQEWDEAWIKLVELLNLLPADDPGRSTLEKTLELCDDAFAAGDWLTFKRGAYAISVAIALRTGLWNPYGEKT